MWTYKCYLKSECTVRSVFNIHPDPLQQTFIHSCIVGNQTDPETIGCLNYLSFHPISRSPRWITTDVTRRGSAGLRPRRLGDEEAWLPNSDEKIVSEKTKPLLLLSLELRSWSSSIDTRRWPSFKVADSSSENQPFVPFRKVSEIAVECVYTWILYYSAIDLR